MGLGQNGHDFSNGMVHIHGGTVTLPREVSSHIMRKERPGFTDRGRTGSVYAPNYSKQRSRWVN